MTVQDIDVDHNIWGKSVPDLKGKTTRKKPIHVAGELVQVPKQLVKLHKDIYFKAYLLFIITINFFLTIIRKICFTAVNYLSKIKLETIFKAFKEIYNYYMKSMFHITTIDADGEFSLLHTMIYYHMPG